MSKKTLLNSKDIEIILHRLACQLIENHNDFSNSVLIGLQPRGSYLANRLVDLLKNEYQIKNLEFGLLDITFYRDDFRRRDSPVRANETKIDFLIEGKKVILVDDVVTSGATSEACWRALTQAGAEQVQVVCFAQVAVGGSGVSSFETNPKSETPEVITTPGAT